MTNLLQKNISDLLRAYRSRETSPEEVCREVFEKIDRYDSKTGAFLKLDREGAMLAAKEAAKDLNRPLAGVPIAIKDVISTKGIETTCSSKILKGYIPPFDATAITRLKNAGAVILGKTNCDEFAMGSSNENSAFQLSRNPWNLDYTPGGSSGGSTVAVACGYAFGALGTDTGGSIRQPASLCGVVGVKPTYGRVSRYGLVAFGSSLDCIGPLARSTEDAALMLKVIAGHDPLDSTSAKAEVPDYSAVLNFDQPLRVGIPEEYFGEGLNSEVESRIQEALKWMEASGKVQLKKISLPNTRYAISVYYVVATAEASSNLSRYDGVKYGYRAAGQNSLEEMYAKTRDQGFGAEVKRRVMLGTFVLSSGYYDAYYLKALKVRSLIAKDFSEAFKDVDVICTPTSPTPAFKIGEKVNDPLSMYLSDIYTVTINLAGLPAISIPCGFTKNGLPVGLQIISNYLKESQMFQLSSLYLKEHPVKLPALSWNN
jgi:aspartyl-tRNA(Asn)/glutamyl-tRNA(Gln) amidotransferase subunit A